MFSERFQGCRNVHVHGCLRVKGLSFSVKWEWAVYGPGLYALSVFQGHGRRECTVEWIKVHGMWLCTQVIKAVDVVLFCAKSVCAFLFFV